MVVAAKDPDGQFFRLFQSQQGRISLLNLRTASAKLEGEKPDLVFAAGQDFPNLICKNTLLILKDGGELPEGYRNPQAVAVLNSSEPRVLELAAGLHLRALTCGRSTADTFTLSSLTQDSAVISLQRPVAAFDATIVEPFELPVVFARPPEPFLLLACAASFCMLGACNPLTGLSRWQLNR